MAAARRNKRNDEWTATGSFMNKPPRGWLHPDDQLQPDAGVCYGVRYIGCMEVKVSMKTLDFATRTAVAKESIARVSEAAGLKSVTKRKKVDKKYGKYLGANPLMHMAGSNVNLTITTDSISMMVMETGEIIAEHQMPGISFASGGDPDTMDFVSYVAKDQVNGRVCYVLECGGGLAQDVITTIGQAFELRFKQYLDSRPTAVDLRDKKTNSSFADGDSWGNEPDYYNDRPGAQPPEEEVVKEPYSTPNNIPVHVYKSMREEKETVYDNRQKDLMSFEEPPNVYDNPRRPPAPAPSSPGATAYDNPRCMSMLGPALQRDNTYDNKGAVGGAVGGLEKKIDPFDMEPFCNTLPRSEMNGDTFHQPSSPDSPEHEEWFHGKMSRSQAEVLLRADGDFLVRESTNSTGQYVLSGLHDGKVKHLLLVDPQGVVRTKDKQFDSVSHLVNYHMTKQLPICSQDSELLLSRPVVHSKA